MIARHVVRCLFALALVSACAEQAPPPLAGLDAETWASLLEHTETEPGLVPPDLSNRFADDPRAAAWGQVLFFDPGFSGALLESDNDGTHDGVGLQGETGKVSCASCHVAEDGFNDTRTRFGQLSLAAGWTRRRTPSVLDVGQASLLMWDGRFDSLQRQVLGVIESPMEANSSRLFFAQEIARRYAPEYEEIFGADPTVVLGSDYPLLTAAETGCRMELTSTTTPDDACSEGTRRGMPGDGADYDALSDAQKTEVTTIALNAGRAIGAYERLLSCGPTRFDAFMAGDASALSDAEIRGAALFVGRGRCSTCHSGPFFSDQAFHNVGLYPRIVSGAFIDDHDRGAQEGLSIAIADPLNTAGALSHGDDGRLPSSVAEDMLGAFRTPMLRCAPQRSSFMHTGQLRRLREVVEFFNEGGDARPDRAPYDGYLGASAIEPLGLTDTEVDDLTAFLEALDGEGPPESLLAPP